MRLEGVYNFLFHPCSEKHSEVCKAISIATIVALSILTAGGFLLLFSYFNWKDHQVSVQTGQNSALNHLWTSQFATKPDLIKNKLSQQLVQFETWAAAGDWERFTPKYSHYDWWMFPVSRSSQQYGDTFAVSQEDVAALKADKEFMQKYRQGVKLVLKSWGWDAETHGPVVNGKPEQRWTGYGVRLGKMAQSLDLFGEETLYQEVQRFYHSSCKNSYPLERWVVDAVSNRHATSGT